MKRPFPRPADSSKMRRRLRNKAIRRADARTLTVLISVDISAFRDAMERLRRSFANATPAFRKFMAVYDQPIPPPPVSRYPNPHGRGWRIPDAPLTKRQGRR